MAPFFMKIAGGVLSSDIALQRLAPLPAILMTACLLADWPYPPGSAISTMLKQKREPAAPSHDTANKADSGSHLTGVELGFHHADHHGQQRDADDAEDEQGKVLPHHRQIAEEVAGIDE